MNFLEKNQIDIIAQTNFKDPELRKILVCIWINIRKHRHKNEHKR